MLSSMTRASSEAAITAFLMSNENNCELQIEQSQEGPYLVFKQTVTDQQHDPEWMKKLVDFMKVHSIVLKNDDEENKLAARLRLCAQAGSILGTTSDADVVSKEKPIDQSSSPRANLKKFFAITRKLPMELQMAIVRKAFGIKKEIVTAQEFDKAFTSIMKLKSLTDLLRSREWEGTASEYVLYSRLEKETGWIQDLSFLSVLATSSAELKSWRLDQKIVQIIIKKIHTLQPELKEIYEPRELLLEAIKKDPKLVLCFDLMCGDNHQARLKLLSNNAMCLLYLPPDQQKEISWGLGDYHKILEADKTLYFFVGDHVLYLMRQDIPRASDDAWLELGKRDGWIRDPKALDALTKLSDSLTADAVVKKLRKLYPELATKYDEPLELLRHAVQEDPTLIACYGVFLRQFPEKQETIQKHVISLILANPSLINYFSSNILVDSRISEVVQEIGQSNELFALIVAVCDEYLEMKER